MAPYRNHVVRHHRVFCLELLNDRPLPLKHLGLLRRSNLAAQGSVIESIFAVFSKCQNKSA